VGQVVAEAIKLYQDNLGAALALGLPVAIVDQLIVDRSLGARIAVLVAASPVFSVAYGFVYLLPTFEFYPWSFGRLAGLLVLLGLLYRVAGRERDGDAFRRARQWLSERAS